MKRKKILDALNLADDRFIEEARPKNSRRQRNLKKLAVFAACFCVLFTSLSLWLFIPFNTTPPSVREYKDSEYYPIIEELNQLTYKRPSYKNNFEKILGNFVMVKEDSMNAPTSNGFASDGEMNEPGASMGNDHIGDIGEKYQETTDNQVAGVIEADLIKRSDKYIYYLRDNTLTVYSIAGEASDKVGSYTLEVKSSEYYHLFNYGWEFYLSKDCKTITLITPIATNTSSYVEIISLDVSDPEKISEKARFTMSGSYLSSRMADGKLLLMSNFYVGRDLDFDKEETFLPQIDLGAGFESISAENIIFPEDMTEARYTVVCKLDEETLELDGFSAFLSYSGEIYVSEGSVYATRGYTEDLIEGDITERRSMTEISRLSYKDSLTPMGSFTVEGYIKDQYSLDEYNGILRVVTTTSKSRFKEVTEGLNSYAQFIRDDLSGTNANLYCIDINSGEVVAKVERFAPQGETVESVRFDKNYAYVCTAVVVTLSDPVFFFDLSDLDNITYKDTGVIDGFSSSLINLGDGFLLGIGMGSDWTTVKVEVYEESENGVVSVCSYVIPRGNYSTEYKSYLVDREHKLFGFGADDYSMAQSSRYILLGFNNYDLIEIVNTELTGEHQYKRALYIDGYLYLFGRHDFKVMAIG